MEGNRFCTKCGAELPDGAAFCPECGATTDPSAAAAVPSYTRAVAKPSLSFAILILGYGILATVLGLMDALTTIGLTEAEYNDMISMMSDAAGMDMSGYMPVWTDSLPVMMSLSMGFLAASGILAIVCYIFCRKAEDWKLTLGLCLASSIACLGICCFSLYSFIGIPLFVIGILMTVLLYLKKGAFANGGI